MVGHDFGAGVLMKLSNVTSHMYICTSTLGQYHQFHIAECRNWKNPDCPWRAKYTLLVFHITLRKTLIRRNVVLRDTSFVVYNLVFKLFWKNCWLVFFFKNAAIYFKTRDIFSVNDSYFIPSILRHVNLLKASGRLDKQCCTREGGS